MTSLRSKREVLLDHIRDYGSCAVAFSAGVDSTVVAKAARIALGDRAIAVTATSASLAEGELDQAVELAARIGIRHEVIETAEQADPRYARNGPDRCYYCKSELYTRIDDLLNRFDVEVIVNGANVDDLGDHRPGMRAASEHRVRSPLAECGFTKNDIRQLAAFWELPVWDKPATPCLASRIAYGEEVTAERLRRVDRAEQQLRELGFGEVRVRYHAADLARIEVPPDEIGRLAETAVRDLLVRRFLELGFRFITVDIQGFRSGSLNAVIPLDALGR